jgi:hypothetical protein
MFTFGKWILSFLSAPLLAAVVDGYKAKLAAANTQDAHAVDLAKAELLATIEAEKSGHALLIAEQGRWYTAAVRPAFAVIVLVVFAKILVWDKVLGWGTTDAIDPRMWSAITIILSSYFGGRSLEKIANVFARRK